MKKKIDIWKEKEKNKVSPQTQNIEESTVKNKIDLNKIKINDSSQSIKIEDGKIDSSLEAKVYGVYDPADYNFNLNMWSSTKADDVRASLKD